MIAIALLTFYFGDSPSRNNGEVQSVVWEGRLVIGGGGARLFAVTLCLLRRPPGGVVGARLHCPRTQRPRDRGCSRPGLEAGLGGELGGQPLGGEHTRLDGLRTKDK